MHKKQILVSIFILVLGLCFLIPPVGMYYVAHNRTLGTIESVPGDMYDMTTSAVSKSVSAKLSEEDRLKLITGEWESEEIKVTRNPLTTSKQQQVTTAQNKVAALYEDSQYPVTLIDRDDMWYTWDVEYYRKTDSTFHIYSAYYYVVHFVGYDEKEKHDVTLSEKGTVVSIKNNLDNPDGEMKEVYSIYAK